MGSSKSAPENAQAEQEAEVVAPPPDPEDHQAFVGRTFKRTGREYPDQVAYTVDDVVRLRHDGYKPKG